MCHASCLGFVNELTLADVAGKRVLEVGSYDVNGSVRIGIVMLGSSEYIGVDMRAGPGVDEVCDASNLVERFGEESFGIVVSTEMLEHVEDWRAAVSNMKRVCKIGGLIIITTRSKGFPKHDYPGDFWRFEIADMQAIFIDCEILKLEKDPQDPGVFLLVRKPEGFREVDLSGYAIRTTSGLKLCERKTDMETQETTILLKKYADGEVEGKKALKELLDAVRKSFPPSHNRTVVMQGIARKIAGDDTTTDVAALASLIGAVSFVPTKADEPGGDTPGPPADDPVDLSDISYSELQTMLKKADLPANGSKEELIERLTKPVDPTE